jgi:hypothetical protein
LWFKGQIVRIDIDTLKLEVIADGFKVPAACKLDSQGRIWVVDTALGQLVRVDPRSGLKALVAQLATGLDNLAIDSKDRVFVSNMADNGIQQIDPSTGTIRQVIRGALAAPCGLAVVSGAQGDELHLADIFAYRKINARTGAVTDMARMHGDPLEYPFSVSANQRNVLLSSWFTGTVQMLDRMTGKSRWIAHGLAAPHDAIELSDGSVIVNEFGSGKMLRLRGPEARDRTTVTDGLAGPVGLTSDGTGLYVTEALEGRITRIDIGSGVKREIAKGLLLPEGLTRASSRQLVVAEVGARRLVSIDTSTGYLAVVLDNLPIGLSGIPGTPPTYMPTGVAVGSDGAVYFTSDLQNAIYRVKCS